MPKRKYSLFYLASWMSITWCDGKPDDIWYYKAVITALLSMDGLKHTWLIRAKDSEDMAVRYTLAQELIRLVAKNLNYVGSIPEQLPWIANSTFYHKLIDDTLPERFKTCVLHNHAAFKFSRNLPENEKFIPVKDETVKIVDHVPFNILDYCKTIKPESDLPTDQYECHLAFFSQMQDKRWKLTVAIPSRRIVFSSSTEPTSLLIYYLNRPRVALLVQDAFMDLSMLLSMADIVGNRSKLEQLLLKTPLYQASDVICNKFRPYRALPIGNTSVTPPTPPIVLSESASSSEASESDLDFSSLSLGDTTDDFTSI